MLILLWGLPADPPLSRVHEELKRRCSPTIMLDQRNVVHTELRFSVGSEFSGSIFVRDQEIDLDAVTALYIRPYDSRRLPEIAEAGPASSSWRHALALEDALLCWAEIAPILVVNPPTAMAPNNSKPYQLEQIRKLGFRVPETLITTDPDAARAFWERHGTVIYKSVSGVRSIVARLRPEHDERLSDISWCPTQFQQYIHGKDYRVHVVGSEVFACEIISEADDYRYAARVTDRPKMRMYRVPQDVEDGCRLLARAMQLPVAGIDLRQSPEGEWYCFEVNPSPGFTYYQQATGQPIAAAIARLLANGKERV